MASYSRERDYNWRGVRQMSEQAMQEHLFNHLTDGKWHHDCPACLRRRVFGGNGMQNLPEETR